MDKREWTLCAFTNLFLHPVATYLAEALCYKLKVADSIPDEAIGFFKWPNPFCCILALGLIQPLTKVGTRNFLGSMKSGWNIRVTSLSLSLSHLSRQCGSFSISILWTSAVCYVDSFAWAWSRSQLKNLTLVFKICHISVMPCRQNTSL
jgi:hypothetical protein